MRVIATILTSALTSAVVSAIIAAYLKYNFDRKLLQLTHRNQLELQETAQNLRIAYETLAEREKQRRDSLPKVAEQVYRVRNSAKAVGNVEDGIDRDRVDKLQDEIEKLEAVLYEQRLLLGLENMFALVQTFKNEAIEFVALAADITLTQDRDRTPDITAEFASSYEEIDRRYVEIVNTIASRLGPPTPVGPMAT
jgi:exonuclease VII large subunit